MICDHYKPHSSKLMARGPYSPPVKMSQCPLLNTSQCDVTEQRDTLVVIVYNPLARPVSQYVRLPVKQREYKVIDPQGTLLALELFHRVEKYRIIRRYKYFNLTLEVHV